MVVSLFTDRRMLDHRVPARHPERPERLQAILRHLERTGYVNTCPAGLVREVTPRELLRVHSPEYLATIAQIDETDATQLDPDTWMLPGSALAGRLAAGSGIEALSYVLEAENRRALCLVRPPGHHARPTTGMGFCIYANIALAAAAAIEQFGLSRVLIADFDVHHGNGTQEIFYDSPQVGFFSIHRFPFYPGTGAADETGTGRGLGTTRNVPLPYGTARRDYLAAFRSELESFADKFQPELVMISAGFDAHAEDPVGDLGLEVEDFEVMTEALVDVAETHSQGRILSMLEGGYNTSILAGCVAAHLQALGAVPGQV
jgi:acetoin utilization deacetylase AcuC-like enzyme